MNTSKRSKLGVSSTVLFTQPYEDTARLAQRLGLDAVELFLDYPQFDLSMKYINNLKHFDIDYLVHLPMFDVNFGSFKSPQKALKEIKAKIKCIAKVVPVKYATLHLGSKPLYSHKGFHKGFDKMIQEFELKAARNTVHSLKELKSFCNKKNVKLNIENLDSPSKFGTDPKELLYFSNYTDGITFDVAHAYLSGYDIDKYYKKIAPKVTVVHASDTIIGKDAHYPVGTLDIPAEYYAKLKPEYFIIEPNPSDVSGLRESVDALVPAIKRL